MKTIRILSLAALLATTATAGFAATSTDTTATGSTSTMTQMPATTNVTPPTGKSQSTVVGQSGQYATPNAKPGSPVGGNGNGNGSTR